MDEHEARREPFLGAREKAFNAETLRAAIEVPMGIACYQCAFTQDANGQTHVVGTHVGIVGSVEEGNAWLRGEEPPGMKRCFSEEAAAEWFKEEARRLKSGA